MLVEDHGAQSVGRPAYCGIRRASRNSNHLIKKSCWAGFASLFAVPELPTERNTQAAHMADPIKMQEVHAVSYLNIYPHAEVVQTVMSEKKALCAEIKELADNRGVGIDIEERKGVISKARAESADM